jgi:hypothetical protein
MYTVDASVSENCKVPVDIYLYFHLLIYVCPKTNKVYIGLLFTCQITPHTTNGNV